MSGPIAHRIVVPRRGRPGVMEWVSGAMPEPGEGEVRVRVEAAGVSAYDVMLRGHWFPGFPPVPYTPGEDLVGIVDEAGPGVVGLTPGQRVGGWTFGDAGGYAAYVCRPACDLVAIPERLAPDVAAAMIVNYLTASLALHRTTGIRQGEWLLVQGAGGGLGSALLQLGREAGMQTIGCDAGEKQAQILADGAEPIDFRTENVVQRTHDITGGGADLVIDLIGGPGQLLRSWRALGPGGRLNMLGMAGSLRSGTGIILPSLILIGILAMMPGRRRLAKGPDMATYPRKHPQWYRDTLTGLFQMAADGRLKPRIAKRLPLRDAARAHALLESGTVSGKVVLICSD